MESPKNLAVLNEWFYEKKLLKIDFCIFYILKKFNNQIFFQISSGSISNIAFPGILALLIDPDRKFYQTLSHAQ